MQDSANGSSEYNVVHSNVYAATSTDQVYIGAEGSGHIGSSGGYNVITVDSNAFQSAATANYQTNDPMLKMTRRHSSVVGKCYK